MSVRDDYCFLTTYMEYGEEDEEEVDWDSVPSSYLYPDDEIIQVVLFQTARSNSSQQSVRRIGEGTRL